MKIESLINELDLTDKFIEYLYKKCRFFIAIDFTGYLFDYSKDWMIAIWKNGRFTVMPKRNMHFLKRKVYKFLINLCRQGFLEQHYKDEPFQEFSYKNNIPYKLENCMVIPDYFFQGVEKQSLNEDICS